MDPWTDTIEFCDTSGVVPIPLEMLPIPMEMLSVVFFMWKLLMANISDSTNSACLVIIDLLSLMR